jgi:2-polyprenyl-6-methoxyphenol hydroxylase-like FAD-dependent oxidoreductase
MKSVIAGGSLGGLMAGLELRAAGLPVSIHERSERVLDDRGAGIVMQPETQQVLIKRCGLRQEETGVWLQYRQYLGKDGKIEFHKAMPQLMTSWGCSIVRCGPHFRQKIISKVTPSFHSRARKER